MKITYEEMESVCLLNFYGISKHHTDAVVKKSMHVKRGVNIKFKNGGLITFLSTYLILDS